MGVTQSGLNASGDVATEQKQDSLILAIIELTVQIQINNAILNEVHELNVGEKDIIKL